MPRRQAGHMAAPDRAAASPIFLLQQGGPFSNRCSIVKIFFYAYVACPGHGSLRGQQSCRNIWSGPEARALQGPQRAYVRSRAHRPATQLPAPSPRGDTLLRGVRKSFDVLCRCGRRRPAKRLPGSPDTVQNDGQFAGQGYTRLAWPGALLDS